MRWLVHLFIFLLFTSTTAFDEESEEEDDREFVNEEDRPKTLHEFLYKRLQEDTPMIPRKKPLNPNIYMIPGPYDPLPGRSHMGDYWPVFPFQNQYSAGIDLDPSTARHLGGDLNVAVPSWGMLDVYGRMYSARVPDTTSKIGFMNHPVNMLDLEKEDFVKLMSDPAMHHNRGAHPTLPLGKLGRQYVPLSCKPPLCNPYHSTFAVGIEHDYGGADGTEGDIDIAMPVGKGIAYRFPFSGNLFYHRDNLTVTYGQNLAPVEPFSSLFDYQLHRDPALAIPRQKRSVDYTVLPPMPPSSMFGGRQSLRADMPYEIMPQPPAPIYTRMQPDMVFVKTQRRPVLSHPLPPTLEHLLMSSEQEWYDDFRHGFRFYDDPRRRKRMNFNPLFV